MQVMDKQKKRRTSTALLSASVFHQCFRFSFLGRRTVLLICLVREFSAYHAHICHLLDNHMPTAVKMTFTVILKVLMMMWFQSFSHMISPFYLLLIRRHLLANIILFFSDCFSTMLFNHSLIPLFISLVRWNFHSFTCNRVSCKSF